MTENYRSVIDLFSCAFPNYLCRFCSLDQRDDFYVDLWCLETQIHLFLYPFQLLLTSQTTLYEDPKKNQHFKLGFFNPSINIPNIALKF